MSVATVVAGLRDPGVPGSAGGVVFLSLCARAIWASPTIGPTVL
jgi:hypothetical protein